MSEAPRVAFKFTNVKKSAIQQPATSSATSFDSETTNNNTQPELVTSLENGQIQSNAPIVTKQELVIPSAPNAHHKFFKLKMSRPPTNDTENNPTDRVVDQLEDEARRALILEANQANAAWDERTENGTARVHTIEQDSINTFGSRLEGKEVPVEQVEEVVDNADYEQVPIEDFGMAVLRGMGYKDDAGLGISNKKKVDVFVPDSRPRGLGLGANRKDLEKLNQLKRNLKKAGIDEKDDLCMEKGACVQIKTGHHTDQYGTIESIDEDVSRVTVALAIVGPNKKKESISISQFNVKLVTEKEFIKYGKYVNKSKADRVEKETTDKLLKDFGRADDDSRRHRSSHKRDDDDDRHHHHRHDDSKKVRRH